MQHTRVVDAIRARASAIGDELSSMVAELVRIPTTDGDEPHAEALLLSWAQRRGWWVERQPIADTEAGRHPDVVGLPNLADRANLFVSPAGLRGRPLLVINAHYDVVPIIDPDDWREPPFSGARVGDAVVGRGAVDNKGGCVAALMAAGIVAELGIDPGVDIVVELIAGEETGLGFGTAAALERFPERWATIVTEPTENAIATANSGAVFFTIETEGRAAHTSVPWRGEDALSSLVDVYLAIRELGRRRDAERTHAGMLDLPTSVPTVVGKLAGGGWRAAVPAHASMSGRIGVLPGESLGEVRAALESVVAQVAESTPWLREHPPVLHWDNDGLPGWELDGHEIVDALASARETIGLDRGVRGITAGCDASLLHRAGVPTVVFGPGDMARAHSPNEYVLQHELVAAVEIIAIAIARLAERIGAAS